MLIATVLYIIIFLYGIIIGSFLNVCILRLPKRESIARGRSHCMSCNYQLKWYDLVPLFSFLALRGRCRKCGKKISWQYPVIEGLNGILYMLVFAGYGVSMDTVLYCLLLSALLTLSIIDFRAGHIPGGIHIFLTSLGLVRIAVSPGELGYYVFGFILAGLLSGLFCIVLKSGGTAGYALLAAECGLAAGWKPGLSGLVLGIVLCLAIRLLYRRGRNQDLQSRLGVFISAGMALAVLWGNIVNIS